MIDSNLLMPIRCEQNSQPAGSIETWIDVLVLGSSVDVLRDTSIEGDIGNKASHTRITVMGSDLLSANAHLYEHLQKDLNR